MSLNVKMLGFLNNRTEMLGFLNSKSWVFLIKSWVFLMEMLGFLNKSKPNHQNKYLLMNHLDTKKLTLQYNQYD